MINFICVVNNIEIYKSYISENSYIKNSNNKIVLNIFDNTSENVSITKKYNGFLDNYDFKNESWLVFCHQDWEVLEDIAQIIKNLDPSKIYGPIGAKTVDFKGKLINERKGFCYEKRRDGSHMQISGNIDCKQEPVDTLDCQCMIVHSSLINKYNLRFDKNLDWDLYVEDFSINAKLKYNIETDVIKIKCCHWSNAGYDKLPKSYYDAKKYLDKKYNDNIYSCTCSFIGGKHFEEPTKKERILYNIRTKMKVSQNA